MGPCSDGLLGITDVWAKLAGERAVEIFGCSVFPPNTPMNSIILTSASSTHRAPFLPYNVHILQQDRLMALIIEVAKHTAQLMSNAIIWRSSSG